MGEVVDFKPNKDNKKYPPPPPEERFLKAEETEVVAFFTGGERNLWVKKPEDIARIISFIARSNIIIFEDK